MNYAEWRTKFVAQLKLRFGITPDDCTDEEQMQNAWSDDTTPSEYVTAIGKDYDLTEIKR